MLSAQFGAVHISIRNAEYRALQNEQKTQEKILDMFNKALESSNIDLSKSTGIKFSKIENFEKLNKETLNNIKMRNGIIIHDEEELLDAIHSLLNDKITKLNYSFGAIPDKTLKRLNVELGDSIQFRNGQYAFIFSSDDIKHINKHFANDKDIAMLWLIFMIPS